jgi:dipeptidyl-peptidase 4
MSNLTPNTEAYTAATAVLDGLLQGKVRNETVQPHWLDDSGKFWYRRDGEAGPEIVMVTPDGGGKWSKSPATAAQCAVPAEPAMSGLLPSPCGKWAAFCHDDNLFVREMATGSERALTTDGMSFYSWGKLPDDSLSVVTRKKSGSKALPFQTFWSPDSRYLIAPRVDERTLRAVPFLEWVPVDGSRRPVVHEVRLGLTGDREQTRTDYFLFDLATGVQHPIALPSGHRPGLFDNLVLGWSQARGQVFLLTRTEGSRSAMVLRLDVASGTLTPVIEENSATRVATNTVEYNAANIRILGDGEEIVWYSDRSGFGHLYLYDAQSGRLKQAITQGDWLVIDIHAVDEPRREIYFTAGGREPGRDPYYRHLCRARLDGGDDTRLLTEPNADHHFDPEPCATRVRLLDMKWPVPMIHTAARVFVDTWSTVGEPPVSVLRSAEDGSVLLELERADASQLYATGWKAPTRECVKAADGVTDLYAVYYAPRVGPAGEGFPVIDAAYGGPQVVVTPRNFIEAYRSDNPIGRSALAQLGFGVVTVDGRGTPMRSRQFRDAGYTEFTQVGIDDHIAVIRQLAERHDGMDLERVGIYGWSWGGTFSAQAILSRPQFYRVSISGAGVYDYAAMYSSQFDNMVGPPRYEDGSPFRGAEAESPVNWEKLDITSLAGNLEGRLMIVYCDMDENVPSQQAFRLVDALTRAGKSYDLVYLANRTHAAKSDPYYIRRTWDYFLQYLMAPGDSARIPRAAPTSTRPTAPARH